MANGQGLLQQAAQNAGAIPQPAALQQQQQPVGAPAPGGPIPGGPVSGEPIPGEPEAAQEAPVSVPSGAAPQGGDLGVDEEAATPREQAELDRAVAALERILYESDNAGNSLMQQVSPEDKVGTAAKASILTVNLIDEQIDLDEIIVAQFTQEVVDRITELAEARYNMEYTERDLQATLGATWEGVMEMFGVDEADYQQFAGTFSEDQVSSLEKTHKEFLGG